jgi:hypothetical protein
MKYKLLLASAALISASSLAAAQDARTLFSDPFPASQDERGPRGRGGQVVEEWYSPTLKASLSFFGRVSWPSDTDVTIDHLWYSDFFDVGWGVTVEADLLQFVAPHYGVGGYLSYNWDQFNGNTIVFPNGDTATPDHMTLNSAFLGAKFLQHLNPWVVWEGRMGAGIVHYSRTTWSGVDLGVPFSNEELFKSITRGAFEIGGRIGAGSPTIQADFGFAVRIMGGAARGKDVTSAIDPDILTTFMLELGLSIRF